MLSINYLLLLALAIFTIGMVGLLIRRNAILNFICIELMLNSAVLTFISFTAYHRSLAGASIAFFILIIAAVEAVVGLSIILLLQRLSGNIDIFNQRELNK